MEKKEPIELRQVREDDAEFLWKLANDPEVREASFSISSIPWASHVKWLKSRLNSSTCILFIAFLKSLPVGQVRYDIASNEAAISISILKQFRGKGIGASVIWLSAKRIFESSDITKIHAYVKYKNKVSVSAFLKANFRTYDTTSVNNQQAIHLILSRDDLK